METVTWEQLHQNNIARRAREAAAKAERLIYMEAQRLAKLAARIEVHPLEYERLQSEANRLEDLALSLASSLARADRPRESERLQVEQAAQLAKEARSAADSIKPFEVKS